MNYKEEILRMVAEIQPEKALKKIYKFVRMVYESLKRQAEGSGK